MIKHILNPLFLQEIAPRFWAKVNKETTTGCWIWTGARSQKGYGVYWYSDKKHIRSHRLSYILTHGPIPNNFEICHSCDNPLCVNPDHLWAGTHQENMTDMVPKQRTNGPKGNRQHLAKLDEEKVRKIRQMYETGRYRKTKLGHIFSVSEATIQQVITRKTWNHI